MTMVAFENLELIPLLLAEIQSMKETINLITPDLSEGIQVQRFLGISRGTLNNLIKRGELREGEHFYMRDNKRVYIPEKIIEFKKTYKKHSKGIKEETALTNNFINEFLKEAA